MSATTSKPSKLDTDRLRKVAALMESGATEGERAAARSRGEAIAAAAGLTLDDALAILGDTPAEPGGFLAGFEDWMEKREPGHKARAARERAEREAARMARCVDHLRRFGSREAVFAETPDECRLRETLAPLADHRAFMDSEETYIAGYCGWQGGGEQPEALREALGRALPFPETIGAVRAEIATWDALNDARMDLEPLGDEPVWIRARRHALERLMDTITAPTVEGVRTRLAWLAELNGRECTRPVEWDAALIAALQADFETIARGLATTVRPAPVQSGHATASQRRRDVRTMLARHPDMPDREIARRCGVSPQTVGNQRRAVAGQ